MSEHPAAPARTMDQRRVAFWAVETAIKFFDYDKPGRALQLAMVLAGAQMLVDFVEEGKQPDLPEDQPGADA